MSDAPRQSLEQEDIMTVTWHGSAAEYRDLVRGVGRKSGFLRKSGIALTWFLQAQAILWPTRGERR